MRRTLFALLSAALLASTAPLLAACTTSSQLSDDEPALVFNDGWAKAAPAEEMTGVFGTLVNDGGTDLVLTGVESDAAAMVEMHEVTLEGVMQEVTDDVVIAAGETFELAPGAHHIMLMALHDDLLAGDEVNVVLTYTAGESLFSTTFTVLVKDYAGANEEYAAEGHDEHGSH